ncbi:MAG: hypothetical protein A3F41_00580 [Coxiella sp. RIFCSPHIGHO2_12_FULL_44_14]|nr:MAG: hypothetical protein A3F41_00580 [Coxiella sp. RIFCSPHIGHO2_12_FULL_44_14]
MDWAGFIDILISLLTLSVLEIVLGVDNLVFLSIVSSRLPPHQQKSARRLGLIAALGMRLLLLAAAVWLATLTRPLFYVADFAIAGKDIFFILGGGFLLIKGVYEIHREIEEMSEQYARRKYASFIGVVVQIGLFDIIFSLDSILTAIGLTQVYWVMASAITVAIIIMLFASEYLSRFIQRHPTVKMLALSFLLLIGTVLVADGLHFYIPRGYIYFSVCFSLFVEFLNNIMQRRRKKRAE